MKTIEDYPEKDTFFFNKKVALQEALKKNRVYTNSPVVDGMQICYYSDEEPFEDAPYNCIWVPLENVYNYFVTTKNRVPSVLNFDETGYTLNEQCQIQEQFNTVLQSAIFERKALEKLYYKEIFEYEPDFTEEELRVFVPSCRETTVMQYVSKNIASAFEELGYNVCYFIQDNDLQSCRDILPYLVELHKAKPHIYISINHFRTPNLLNPKVFHFAWFQDPMPQLVDKSFKPQPNERDFIFSVTETIMNKKFQAHEYEIQKVCVDISLFKPNPSIKRENKIVFLGTSYKGLSNQLSKKLQALYDTFVTMLNKGERINNAYLKKLSKETHLSYDEILYGPLSYAVREVTVEWICQQDIIDVEVYGRCWESNPIVKPYFKGEVPYGDAISNIYNSAKYSLSSHPSSMFMTRLPEMTACGTIPVLFDARELETNPFDYEDESLIFSTYEELRELLTQEPKGDVMRIANEHSYDKFVKRIDTIIQELNKEEL